MLKIHTHYNNLKVSNNASVAEIRAAYKALMQQYHPDKFDGDAEDAIRIVNIIQTSYAVLSNPQKRAKHDIWITTQKNEEKRKSTKTSNTTSESSIKPVYYQQDKQKSTTSESAQSEQKVQSETRNSGLSTIIPVFILVALILVFAGKSEAPSSNKASSLASALNKKDSEIDFIYVKPGCFQMGHNGFYENEKPLHRACLTKGYYLGKYEVTQAQWLNVMSINPSRFKGNNLPVEKISWNDVQTFINKLNQKSGKQYRLPTEAEWEFACRSTRKTKKYCDTSVIDKVTWYKYNSEGKTHPVGKKKPVGLGFYDMNGNVMEWIQDRYHSDYYDLSPAHDPKGPLTGSEHVIRGGSWRDIQWLARSSQRQGKDSNYNSPAIGFRLARSP